MKKNLKLNGLMTEFQKYIQIYLDLVKPDFRAEMQRNLTETLLAFSKWETNEDYSYAEGKWSVKCLLQHIIDTEKIFSYRALCFCRNESQNLPGFDQNTYAESSQEVPTSLAKLLTEFRLLRELNLLFFENLSPQDLHKKGLSNGNTIDVECVGRLIVGHCKHHLNLLNERYLPELKKQCKP